MPKRKKIPNICERYMALSANSNADAKSTPELFIFEMLQELNPKRHPELVSGSQLISDFGRQNLNFADAQDAEMNSA